MTDEAKQREVCAWCGEPATTEVYIEGHARTKKRKKAHVCREHEEKFAKDGAITTEQESRRMAGFDS